MQSNFRIPVAHAAFDLRNWKVDASTQSLTPDEVFGDPNPAISFSSTWEYLVPDIQYLSTQVLI